MTRFSPCPSTRTQPAATTSAMPASTKRPRYGQTKRRTRASCRILRLGGRSGRLSISRAMGPFPSGLSQALFERDDPVVHRQLRAALEMRQAADVGGGDLLWLARGERRE